MRGAERLALRREREAKAPVVLQAGFRPFFFASAIWLPSAMLLWLATLMGVFELSGTLPPAAWHRHELIFGGVGAAMAGYLLTATPNWSGRLPTVGPPLLLMVAWWALARIVNTFIELTPPWLAAVIDAGFFLALAAAIGREAIRPSGRGRVIAVLAAMFAIACGADHLAIFAAITSQLDFHRLGIAVLVVLLSIVSGKLIPSFTRNALRKAASDTVTSQGTRFDNVVDWVTALAAFSWIANVGGVTPSMLALAALLQLARAIRWRPWLIVREPSVLALHLAYAWLPIGLLGLALAGDDGLSDAIHLLTAGAISCMVLAVMARITVTQTGRVPTWRSAPLAAVLLVSAGAAVRAIAGSELIPLPAAWLMAGLSWLLGYFVFLIVFGPMLLRPRVSRRTS